MNYSDYCIHDYETTSANPDTTQPVQLAAVMVHGRKLEIKPGSEFNSLIKPVMDEEECERLGLDKMQKGAARVHGLTEDMLMDAPSLKSVWGNFGEYVSSHCYEGKEFFRPIGVGYNNHNFDDVITRRICSQDPYDYGPKNKKFPRGTMFHPIRSLDVQEMMHIMFENDKAVSSLSADNLIRGHMGYSKGRAHDALSDVIMTAELFCRYMKMIRGVAKNRKFKGAFAND